MRRAGIDSGSRWIGIVISDGDAAPLALVHRATIELGEEVPLDKPVKRADGTMKTHRRVITGAEAARVAALLRALCVEHGVQRAITEQVRDVFLNPEDSHAAHRAQASAVNKTSWVLGRIQATLEAAGIEVPEGVNQASARARVAGRSKGRRGGSSPERIPEACRRGFVDWPDEAGEHERDAAILCLYDVTPARVPAPKAAPVGPRLPQLPKPRTGPKKPSGGWWGACLAAERQTFPRCTCQNRRARHKADCPEFTGNR